MNSENNQEEQNYCLTYSEPAKKSLHMFVLIMNKCSICAGVKVSPTKNDSICNNHHTINVIKPAIENIPCVDTRLLEVIPDGERGVKFGDRSPEE